MLRILAALAALPALAAPPARILILTGQSDTAYHDWRATTPFLERVLHEAGRFEVREDDEPRGLTREALANYDAVILNYNGPRWGAAAEAALEEFIRSGHGMISFHGVTYGPLMGTVQRPGGGWNLAPAWPAYADLLGVSWKPENIGHAVRHAFPVQVADPEHPVTRGLPARFLVNDELYHRMGHRPGAHVLLTAFDDTAHGGTGKTEPIAWTVAYGKGRTFHCTLGHDTSALYQPEVMSLFARAAEWAATGDVAPAAPPANDTVRVLVVTGGHAYEPSFYSVFEGQPDIRWHHVWTQKDAFAGRMAERWDVAVLYDLYNQIGEGEAQNLRQFVEAGKGVVALHHSIVDYTSWPWWYEQVIGGKYFEKPEGGHPASHFKEGVPIVARPARGMQNHPIVRGLGELATTDECYNGMWHSPGITVLMETDSPCNDRPLVYLGPRPGARVVYIQLGHGTFTHEHPGYRKLVHQAILWAAGRAR